MHRDSNDRIMLSILTKKDSALLYRQASILALFTIFYNIIEGLISIYFGIEDETIALAGFGIDSFVETISGIGIFHMIKRIENNGSKNFDVFEKTALKITGIAFYFLTAGLIISSMINIYMRNKPETTIWGIVISIISLTIMWILIHYKLKVGKKLNSQAIITDAKCTRACMYLSIILFASSVTYEIWGFTDIDSLGAIAIALWSLKEGKEAMDKSKGKLCNCESASCEV